MMDDNIIGFPTTTEEDSAYDEVIFHLASNMLRRNINTVAEFLYDAGYDLENEIFQNGFDIGVEKLIETMNITIKNGLVEIED